MPFIQHRSRANRRLVSNSNHVNGKISPDNNRRKTSVNRGRHNSHALPKSHALKSIHAPRSVHRNIKKRTMSIINQACPSTQPR